MTAIAYLEVQFGSGAVVAELQPNVVLVDEVYAPPVFSDKASIRKCLIALSIRMKRSCKHFYNQVRQASPTESHAKPLQSNRIIPSYHLEKASDTEAAHSPLCAKVLSPFLAS